MLVLIVNGVMPPMRAGASTPSSHWSIDLGPGDDDHGCGSQDPSCPCCLAEVETAPVRTELAVRLPATGYAFIANSGPVTNEHVRLPFRPPIAV